MVVMDKEEITHPAPPLELQKPPEPEPRQPVMINVNDVDFCYGTNQVLFEVNLEIPPRAVTAFIGPSGCGKTTLLRCFNRMNDLIDGARISAGCIRLVLFANELHHEHSAGAAGMMRVMMDCEHVERRT